MFGIDNYIGFIVAGILLNITPGADTIYIVTRSVSQGRKAGFYSVLGISSGGFIHTMFAAFGLSAILAQSALAFSIVKYIGVAYLFYLGINMLLKRKHTTISENEKKQLVHGTIFRQAFFTNVLNPKVALFFLSFLPQFINPEHAQGAIPFLILGFTFMFTGTLWCMVLAFAASSVTKILRNNTI